MTRIAIIVKGYPRLSETFIAQEILGLEKQGIRQLIVSLRHPTETKVHDLNREISADVLYLPEYLKDDPKRVKEARDWAESRPGFASAWAAFQADFSRDHTVNRQRRFGQACVLAHELPADIAWLHAHFLHTPASVARYAALIRGMEWSFSAHAKDIWTTPEWELREKLADAAWGVTCTQANLDYLRSLGGNTNDLHLVYHGLDFSRVPAKSRKTKNRGPLTIVSVGRAVEKKGYPDLLRALALLPVNTKWRFEHAGGGPLAAKLKKEAKDLGLADRITWHGSQDREFIFALLARADVFVLPSRLTSSGDRDGLPNVLMEAQAFGVPVLATEVSGIPELVTHAENGLLVPQKDPAALASALSQLLSDSALRRRLGEAGARTVRKNFSSEPGISFIASRLQQSLARRKVHAPEDEAEKQRFIGLLQVAEQQSRKIRFWWRDDDAETVTPALDALLSLAGRYRLPLGLAVVPRPATETLAARLARENRVWVLQHGWEHKRHSPEGDKKMELGDHRPLVEILSELELGFERLASLFPGRFLPVLVPPWNRISGAVYTARSGVGLFGLSGFGPVAGQPHVVNTHVDIFDWHGTRGTLPRATIYATLCKEMERRLADSEEPIGLLTHHLIHEPESWDFLEDLLSLIAKHPAVEWPDLPGLFAVSSVTPPDRSPPSPR